MSLADKMAKFDEAVAGLRHVVRHNGAAISAKADINEVAAHVLDVNPDRVKTLWTDIGTIDGIKKYLKLAKNMKRGTVELLRWANPMKFPEMTTEELLEYGINDERLTAQELSWAVIKVTKKGAELLTYGGNFYQAYLKQKYYGEIFPYTEISKVADPTAYGLEAGDYYLLEGAACEIGQHYRVTFGTTILSIYVQASGMHDAYGSAKNGNTTGAIVVMNGQTFIQITYADGSEAPASASIKMEIELETFEQSGDTELLKQVLEAVDAAWMAETFEADVQAMNAVYTEGGVDYIQIPCNLPGDLSQLISISIERTKLEDDSEAAPLQYSLTDKSCDTSNEGMVELPHGMWLIYDNSTLESAPQALLIPKDLAQGKGTGYRFDKLIITYNSLASGLARLRLVGDSFGDEYIISTQEDLSGGTWRE